MKILMTFVICLMSFISPQAEELSQQFEKLLPIMTAKVEGKEVTPKTTAELEKLFNTEKGTVPRLFVKKLPKDFTEKGSKELYAKVLTALILRENEQILGDRYLFLVLKEKYEKGLEWTKKEKQFFDSMVEKYDSTVLKTIPTKIADLMEKIDEVPPAVAITQSALQTNWGKENMESPYGQKGWLDRENYDFVKYSDLIKATESYVREMNSTPNYDMWRKQRARQTYNQTPQASFHMIQALRAYMPEDVYYLEKLKKVINQNQILYDYDDVIFQKSKSKK